MFYPTDPNEMYGLFALRLGKYKAHFYTRGTVGFICTIFVEISRSSFIPRSDLRCFLALSWLSMFVHQVPVTAVLSQTQTAHQLQPSRPTTPLFFLTWRPTPRSTTPYLLRETLTLKPCWRESRKSRSSLSPPWCSERARYQKGRTGTWSPAAIPRVALNPAAATADGTDS